MKFKFIHQNSDLIKITENEIHEAVKLAPHADEESKSLIIARDEMEISTLNAIFFISLRC